MAASGTVGLETAFAALYAGLVLPGELTLERLIEALTSGPCRAWGWRRRSCGWARRRTAAWSTWTSAGP